MTDLKPCPFCGGKISKFTAPLKNTQMFVCHKCGADVCFYCAEYEPKASKAWNRRAETVFDPFAGLFTVPMTAVKMNREGYGVVLNQDYFRDGVMYLREADAGRDMPTLFDMVGG